MTWTRMMSLISRLRVGPAWLLLWRCALAWACCWSSGVPAAARAETVWSRWFGAWEVSLDWQPEGGTCLWSTYDGRPPSNIRRLTFAISRTSDVVVIVSDRREPIHRLPAGPSATLKLGEQTYALELGLGIPLSGVPGGMLIGQLAVGRASDFVHDFGRRRNGDPGRLQVTDRWVWHFSLRGAASAAEEVASCMEVLSRSRTG